jgi:hypothetical protein
MEESFPLWRKASHAEGPDDRDESELRDVLFCHWRNCRRSHRHVTAYAAARRDDLVLTEDRGLKWYRSTQDVTSSVHRGFCQECGAGLF